MASYTHFGTASTVQNICREINNIFMQDAQYCLSVRLFFKPDGQLIVILHPDSEGV